MFDLPDPSPPFTNESLRRFVADMRAAFDALQEACAAAITPWPMVSTEDTGRIVARLKRLMARGECLPPPPPRDPLEVSPKSRWWPLGRHDLRRMNLRAQRLEPRHILARPGFSGDRGVAPQHP